MVEAIERDNSSSSPEEAEEVKMEHDATADT